MAVNPRMVINFFTKKQCSLCVPAKANILRASQKFDNAIEINEVDIEKPENRSWYDLYKWDIPAGRVDNEEIFRHRISEQQMTDIYLQWKKKKLEEE